MNHGNALLDNFDFSKHSTEPLSDAELKDIAHDSLDDAKRHHPATWINEAVYIEDRDADAFLALYQAGDHAELGRIFAARIKEGLLSEAEDIFYNRTGVDGVRDYL